MLAEAQRLGYAEADPTLDIGGGDTAHKLTLSASLAFGTVPDLGGVAMTGIEQGQPADIAFAARVRLSASSCLASPAGRRTGSSSGSIRRWSRRAPRWPMWSGASMRVAGRCGRRGPFFFQGRGAGAGPDRLGGGRRSSSMSRAARSARPSAGPASELGARPSAAPAEARVSAYYLRFQVLDVPGVMAAISRHLANERVSIESMIQRGRSPGEPVAIVMITHEIQPRRGGARLEGDCGVRQGGRSPVHDSDGSV